MNTMYAKSTPGRVSLLQRWLIAAAVAGVCLAANRVSQHPSGRIELAPVETSWARATMGEVAYPPPVDNRTPVWSSWLAQPDLTQGVGPAPPSADETDELVFHAVSVTGYSSRIQETDDSPFITAINTITAPGVLAVSRDLLRTFTPGAPFDFGDRVVLSGVGVYQIEDTMHPRWERRVDVWFPSTEEALAWGRRETYMAVVEESLPITPYEIPLAWLDEEPVDLRHHSGMETPWRILR